MKSSAVSLTVLLICCRAYGAAPLIGMGDGVSPLAEGAIFEAPAAGSQFKLTSGVSVRLAPRAAGLVYRDHLVLETGGARVDHFDGYSIDVRALHVLTEDSATAAVVRLDSKTVEVASLGGNLRVTDGGGLMRQLTAGTRLTFQQGQPWAPARSKNLPADHHVMLWLIGITGAAALGIGIAAAVQDKSPF